MASIFGGSKPKPQNATPPATSLRIQTSVEGKAKPIVWGTARVPANMLWYGGFISYPLSQFQSSGKGGIFNAQGGGGANETQTVYQFGVILGLCEGPVSGFSRMWQGKTLLPTIAPYGGFVGGPSQAPWSFLVARYPAAAENYRTTAYLAGVPAFLSAELPNTTVEVTSVLPPALVGLFDVSPTDWLADLLDNPNYGVPGWTSAWNADWTMAKGYFIATGLLISYALTDNTTANQFAANVIESVNALPVWSEGVLKLVPLGDQQIIAGTVTPGTTTVTVPSTGSELPPFATQVATAATFVEDNGCKFQGSGIVLTKVASQLITGKVLDEGTYAVDEHGLYQFAAADVGVNIIVSFKSASQGSFNPPTTALYDFDDTNIIQNQSSFGNSSSDPVAGQMKAPRDQNNVVKVNFLDRSSDYNPAQTSAKDDAAILQFGERGSKGAKDWHWFLTRGAADMAAALGLGREQVGNYYAFTSRPGFASLLEPGDIVTISDPGMSLARQWARIRKITENGDRSLSLMVQEYLFGSGAAPAYGTQSSLGAIPNYDADPGAINPPLLFEPTDHLAGGLFIWAAVSGASTAFYGGCDVYASYSGADSDYAFVDRQFGAARMGFTTAPIASFPFDPTGNPTIDAVNTLSVDLTESAGTLITVSQQDALALNTASYVDGEVLAFQTATLIATSKYNLTYLVRGAYDTPIAAHATGSQFARLDQGILKIPYDQSRIGNTIYLKFVPFNPWGGGRKTLADVGPVAYTITGLALASPLPQVQNVTIKFVDGRLNLSWDEVDDFRTGIRYEIRKGPSPDGAVSLGTLAHPPFPVPGDGTYHVSAWVQPVAGLIVRSDLWSTRVISGSTVNTNVLAFFDAGAAGWPGIFLNGAVVDTGLNALRTGSAGNILTETNILTDPDALNLGGSISGGYKPAFVVDIGRVAPVAITISLVGTGTPIGQNILADGDILSMPDFLGSASSRFIDVSAQVYISQSPTGSILGDTNVLTDPDILTFGIPFAAPIKYSPGIFVGRIFGFEIDIDTIDPGTIGYCLSATIAVDTPNRTDNNATIGGVLTSLTGITIPAAGLALTFTPNGTTTPASFNGGPSGTPGTGSLPQVVVSWAGPDKQTGDYELISNLTQSGCTVKIFDSTNTPVQRTKGVIIPRGY